MSSIQTGIELNDQFTSVIYGIINSVNLAVSSMADMQQSMNADIDTSSLEGARDEINQATAAMNELNAAMHSQTAPDIIPPTVDGGNQEPISVPVEPTLPDPLIENPPPIETPIQPNAPPDPVEIPIQWETDGLDVFTSTGIDRFRQEVQSTNSMLEQLSSTQDSIARQAYNTMIFPPEAFQNLNSLAVRVDMVRDRIQQIENNPVNIGTDTANAELEQLRSQLNQALQAQNNLNSAMDNMDVSAANDAYLRLSQTVSSTERYIRDNTDEQGRFNQSVRECQVQAARVSDSFAGWQKAIIVANQAMGLIKSTLSGVGVMDMSGAFSRLDTMSRFEKTITIMTGDANLANAALSQLRDTTLGTAYGLDVAAKSTQGFMTRGMSLGAATNQVRVWADAVSFYGEGTNVQLESVVDAIGKMYSKGKVEADQLDRLFDAGIGAAEIYANAVGESVSAVKEDLSAGTISASKFIDVVSQAMDAGISAGAAKDAGSTWATTFANMHAAITRGWTNIITDLDSAFASHGLPSSMQMVATFGKNMENTLKRIGNSMDFVVGATMQVYDVMSTVAGFIADNWSIISPIVYGVVAALAVYATFLAITKAAEMAGTAIKIAMCVAEYAHAAATGAAVAATTAETAAQLGLNSAFLACPLVWIILLIIALIAIIFAVASAIAKMTGVASSGFGVITGGINVVIQFFKNLGLTVANIALGIGSAIGAVASNIMTAFHNAISSVQAWWYDLLSTVLTVVSGICESLNKLPFVEFDYSGITSAADEYAAKSAEAAGNKQEYTSVVDAFNKGMSTFDTFQDGWATNAFDSGAAWGDGVADKVTNFFDKTIPNADDFTSGLEDLGMVGNLDSIANDTKGIKDAMDITEEDLKYLRDIAEQEAVNRYTVAEVKIEQTNNNNISSDIDLDGFITGLDDAMGEAIEIITEGGV